jgi:aryl-alcohol dehydrogenase-like predicted oxidoreductase
MKKIKLGHSDMSVGAIAYGCWRFAESTQKDADVKIRTALDAGMTLIDTADIYGLGEASGFGGAEAVLGEVLTADKSLRRQMILATKGGIDAIRPYDSSYDYIVKAMDASLLRLKTDYVDLYQIHRPDLTTPFEDTARALNDIVTAGKARYIGVSNFTPSQTRALQAHLDAPLITTQPEFSALEQSPITDGTFDLCMEKTMTALLWSPLAGGALATGKRPKHITQKKRKARFERVMGVIEHLTQHYNTERSHIALAFTIGHGAQAIPIIGTQNTKRIKASAKALGIGLTARDFYDIVEAYRGEGMP